MTNLNSEIQYFEEVEPKLLKQGLRGKFVVIHDHEILVTAVSPDEAVRKLMLKYGAQKLPEPLLVREVEGDDRQPISMRSPRVR